MDDVQDESARWWHLPLALSAVAVVWVPLFVVRLHAHQANVDDFNYASITRDLLQAPDPLTAVLTTGPTSPLVLVLATPGLTIGGVYGAMSVELPLLLLLCVGAYVLARTWLSKPVSVLVSLLVGLNAAVLAYAIMLNFALASTACVVWCFATYLRSEKMHRWGWSAGFGVAFAALTLSRSMAPVYALPLASVIGADVLRAAWKREAGVGRAAPLSIGLVLLIAGPWWIRSGASVMHYLLNAGYQASSGDTTRGIALTPSTVFNRANWELLNLGWIQSLALGAVLLMSLLVWARSRHEKRYANLWMLWIWSVLTLLILSSSNNLGTGFGIPIIVILIVACGVVLGRAITHHRAFVATALLLLVAISSAGVFTASRSIWWPGPPYRVQVLDAGGTTRTNVDALSVNVGVAIGRRPSVLAVENGVLNGNGVAWANPRASLELPSPPRPTLKLINDLRDAHTLVTGRSVEFTYAGQISDFAIESAAVRLGFRPVKVWVVSRTDDIVLWRRGSKTVASAQTAPTVQIDRPASGSKVHGLTYLVAGANDLFGVSSVKYVVSGGPTSYKVTLRAGPTFFGWLAEWNASDAPPGRYVISCVASNLVGVTSRTSVSVEVVEPS